MADVLIKGMEMPKHCGECGIEWCNRWKKLIVAGMPCAKSRPSDCPLIHVPDHGRLIDADRFYEDVTESAIMSNDFKEMFVLWLETQETVIPASTEEDNDIPMEYFESGGK